MSTKIGDLERCNGTYFALSLKSVAFEAHYIKVIEDTPILSATEM